MSNTRWQIWGRYCGGREMFLDKVQVHDQRHDELSGAAKDYGPRWFLWLEGFPHEHPHAALRRRLASHDNLGRPKSKPQPEPDQEEHDEEAPEGPMTVIIEPPAPPEPHLSPPDSLMP